MSSSRSLLMAALLLALAAGAAASASHPGIGRPATASEIAAWDIDVRPDFKGLPPGSGSVADGLVLWEARCASCHGVFGESNEVFAPLVGGTSAEDIASGRVARLRDPAYPGRTTMMKVSTVSTLWDYINRAMPWNQPKSLSADEVYAVLAYLLNLAQVVPDDFVLGDKNIAQVQQRMPNRDGMTLDHGLWPGKGIGDGRPDVRATACMKDCAGGPKVASILPDFARNAHGNLAEQNRTVGAQHGADTTRPAGAPRPATTVAATAPQAASAQDLLARNGCTACHGMDNTLVGPALRAIAAKYAGRDDRVAYLAGKIRDGGSGVWGAAAMPAQTLPRADLDAIAAWLGAGAGP